MKDIVIGLDIGTSNCKAAALSVEDDSPPPIVASVPYDEGADEPTIDVRIAWRAVCDVLARLMTNLRQATIEPSRIAGLALSGAMHSLLPVLRDGTPLTPASTWKDTSSIDAGAALRRACDVAALYGRTGCPVQWLYHPAKLRHLHAHSPGVFGTAELFVTIKDWIAFRLTGEWSTDVSMASACGLLDLATGAYCDEALRLAGVESDRLPPLLHPHEIVGTLTAEVDDAPWRAVAAPGFSPGLPAGLPVFAGGSDGAMANIGAGAYRDGDIVVTLGTSGAVRVTVDQPRLDAAQRTWCYHMAGGRYIAGGAINNGGLAVQWVRDSFYPPGATFDDVLSHAASIDIGAGGVIVLPYLTGERCPHWRADLRPSIHGLEPRHSRAHVARATLEATAFCLRDVWECLFPDAPGIKTPVRLTGRVTTSDVWRQIVCDVLNVPMLAGESADASALGAAVVGHIGAGNLKTIDSRQPSQHQATLLKPDPARAAQYLDVYARWKETVNGALDRLGPT